MNQDHEKKWEEAMRLAFRKAWEQTKGDKDVLEDWAILWTDTLIREQLSLSKPKL